MARIFDFLLDDTGDLAVSAGDLLIGESTEQHLRLIIESEPGALRQTPYVGAGLRSAVLDDQAPAALQQDIQAQLELDGVTVHQLVLASDGTLAVAGNYASPHD